MKKISISWTAYTMHTFMPDSRGFVALVAVLVLALGTLGFCLATMTAVYEYSDYVTAHELRLAANLNAHSCLVSAKLMLAKDYFLSGTTPVPEFGCTVSVYPRAPGNARIEIEASVNGVRARMQSE